MVEKRKYEAQGSKNNYPPSTMEFQPMDVVPLEQAMVHVANELAEFNKKFDALLHIFVLLQSKDKDVASHKIQHILAELVTKEK